MLVNARDAETGEGLDDQHVFDQLTGLVLAGHETSANALSWTLFFLTQHPEIVERLLREYESVLGDRAPTLDDVPRLVETKNVLNESLRLRPPLWIVTRTAVADDEIGGFSIKRGQMIWCSPWVLHRNPAIWDAPEKFDPDRFTPDRSKDRHWLAFSPFGAGQKLCIGQGFAMLEMQLALPVLVRGFQYRLPAGVNVTPEPFVTLRPRGGLPMHVERRNPRASQQLGAS